MTNAKKFYSVSYRDLSVEGVSASVIAKVDDVIKACSLALNIHQFSNVSHVITVSVIGFDPILTLSD